jgi:hypothetical protein
MRIRQPLSPRLSLSLFIQHLEEPQLPRNLDGSGMLHVVEIPATASLKYTCLKRRKQ